MSKSIPHSQAAGRHGWSRRDWLRLTSAGVLGGSLSGWMQALADNTADHPHRRKSCILLWMDGGPAQTDTFDMKPGYANGGLFKPIATNVPGIHISEHLPRIAQHMDRLAIIRSMNTRANDHPPGANLMHTGHVPGGPIPYPTLGAIVAKEIGSAEVVLPHFVSIAPGVYAPGAGFLGPKYGPMIVAGQHNNNEDKALTVPDLALPPGVGEQRFDARVELFKDLEKNALERRPGLASKSHETAYERAVTLVRTAARKTFNLEDEPARLRDAYGRNLFGQGCLLARRLVEQGVPFVEVTLSSQPGHNSWDTHVLNFDTVRRLSEVLDAAWAQLLDDLKERGLLDSTLLVWAGEFGRTPEIHHGGRDHWATGWSTVLAGGGIKGGQVIGKTSADGMRIVDRPIAAADFLATIVQALGIDPATVNLSSTGQPIPIAEKSARPIAELLGG